MILIKIFDTDFPLAAVIPENPPNSIWAPRPFGHVDMPSGKRNKVNNSMTPTTTWHKRAYETIQIVSPRQPQKDEPRINTVTPDCPLEGNLSVIPAKGRRP